jgi:hypothetical protein
MNNSTNPKKNPAARRQRPVYANGTRSDGAIVIRAKNAPSRSKYEPHFGKKEFGPAQP